MAWHSGAEEWAILGDTTDDQGDATVDPKWPEAEINRYARNMRSLFRCVKGLAILVITWSTVVLLGGFVSVLQKKDFWSLTVITVVQLTGSDHYLVDKWGGTILVPYRFAAIKCGRIFDGEHTLVFRVVQFMNAVPQAVISAINILILIPFVFGLCISTGISLWCLVTRDYGSTDGDGNLKSALDFLYLLGLVQGVLFLIMNIFSLRRRKLLVKQVTEHYKLQQANLIVPEYLETIVAGRMRDNSFTDGRNLVTYAVDLLMEPKSPERYIKGIKDVREMLEASLGTNREMMMKQLLIDCVSFSHIVRKLLRVMNPRSRYSRETREHAVGIVMFLVESVHLEQFPGAIQSISSLLDISEEYLCLLKEYHQDCALGLAEAYDQEDWLLEIKGRYDVHKKYELGQQEVPEPFKEFLCMHKKMFLQGLRILQCLADDEGNCRVISNTEGLMSRITAPLISSRLHQDYHEEWTSIAEKSLPLLCRFMATPGKSRAELRRQISSIGEVLTRTLQILLMCDACFNGKVLLSIAVEILLDLSMDTSFIMASGEWSTRFIVVLLHIFLQKYSSDELESFGDMYCNIHWIKKRNYIRNLAGEQLVRLSSQSVRSAMFILRAASESSPSLGDLTNTLVAVGAKNNTYRMRAAEILEHLCSNYTNDDNYLKSLKEAVLQAVPKVLAEVLGCGWTGAFTQAGTEANQPSYSATDADIEQGPALHDNGQASILSSTQQNSEQHRDEKLHEVLLSLCATVCQKLISTDPDLARRFDEVASKICLEQGKPLMGFSLLVEEAREILKKKNEGVDAAICIG